METGTASPYVALSALAIAVMAAVHVLGYRMRFLSYVPRSGWLSAAGGVAVAYVIVHVLPELAGYREHLGPGLADRALGLPVGEVLVYLFTLLGLVAFYGVERLAQRYRRAPTRARDVPPPPLVFRVHMATYAVYNALIGYLVLHREVKGLPSLLFFTVAMALHFLVNDRGLAQEHGAAYERVGRWLLAGAAVAGWLIGLFLPVPMGVLAALFAVLAGGTILNVMKEELPEERQSRFLPFLGGAAAYTVLLLLA
ncbi:MAG: hypothetical protein KDG89_10090 [Geminicoccaceae bacterium]|nr:hypothetical protein [Geminicoccaceae bacterium]